MYDYSEYIPLNFNTILERVSQQAIFEMVLGYKPIEYMRVVSPFREDDTTPGCFFSTYNNKLWFIDFADKTTHRDCINMVEDLFKISFYDALRHINNHFQLGLGSMKSTDTILQNNIIPEKLSLKPKLPVDIEFKPRDFNDEDREYWTKYGISKNNLLIDGVYPVIWYKLYSARLKTHIVIRPTKVTYAYTGFVDMEGNIQSNKIKIYTPYLSTKGKWVTNCIANDIGNIQNLPLTGEKLVITKSYKDCRVIRNFNIDSIWFQNEGMFPDIEILMDLCNRFEHIYIFFDNDSVGIETAIKLSELLNSIIPDKSTVIFLPKSLLKIDIKDPSDTIHKKGEKYLKKFLKSNNLLGDEEEKPF